MYWRFLRSSCALAAACALCALMPALAFEKPRAEPADDSPQIEVRFHKGGTKRMPEVTMRFGITLPNLKDAATPTQLKQLTYDPEGVTSNTCVKIDGDEHLLGHPPGKWVQREGKLGQDKQGKERLGLRSVYLYEEEHLEVTQTVEVVRGEQTGNVDTCLVHYLIENKGDGGRKVGLRYLLDTYIGSNDGAPFIIPGQKELCETQMEFNKAAEVPPFVQALERLDLHNPGVIAHLKLKMNGGLEAPVRLTLGAWPDARTGIEGARDGLTLWDVPVFSIKKYHDSAAVIYWAEKEMKAGERRQLGFAYGLGNFSGDDSGRLGMTLAGTFQAGDEMTVLALVRNPKEGQTLTLKVPEGFELLEGEKVQVVPQPPEGAGNKIGPVTWRVRTPREGIFPITIQSSAGASHTQGVRINKAAEKENEKKLPRVEEGD